MKTRIFSLAFAVSLSFFSTAQIKNRTIQEEIDSIWHYEVPKRTQKLKDILNNAESTLKGLDIVESSYWKAYIHYKIGISHISDNKEKARKHFSTGINFLAQLDNPNSETCALQGTLNSSMISVQSDKAWALSLKAAELFNKSLKHSEENPRAYLGLGKSDFYKPAQYGGGKMVESHLKKAISYYSEQELSEKKGPSWGKDEAYYFLSAFYFKNDRSRDAKFYNNLGLKEFPQNKLLLAQKEKLD